MDPGLGAGRRGAVYPGLVGAHLFGQVAGGALVVTTRTLIEFTTDQERNNHSSPGFIFFCRHNPDKFGQDLISIPAHLENCGDGVC
jgi:hypothetical protein